MLHGHKSPAVAGAYLWGATLGAALSASVVLLVSGLLSPIPPFVRLALLLGLVGVLVVRALGFVTFVLPQNRRQIPEHAFGAKPTQAAFRFAFELGTAARTYITKEAAYVAALTLAFAAPSGLVPAAGATALLATGFGLGRSTIMIGASWRSSMITQHPPWSLTAANFATMAMAVVVALRLL